MELINGFVYLFSDEMAIAFVLLGAVVGVVIGAMPGLTTAAVIAMLVPLTYYMQPLHALVFLYVIGKAGRFGGSIAAILFNTPGTAAAAATVIDGNAMARRGMPGKALKTASVSSVIGDFMGDALLIFGVVWVSSITEKMGPPEYFAVFMMAFLIISSVVGSSVTRGIVSTAAGIIISMIGIDPIEGMPRLDFGLLDFQSGMALVPLLLGMFVISEIALQLENNLRFKGKAIAIAPLVEGGEKLSWSEIRRCLPLIFKSSAIGAFIGILPGIGSSVAAFAAYGEGKRRSKTPEKWGTGIVEGIAAPESANNAVSGPTMIPLLALGIPGSTIAAILLGVFLIHGIMVGPQIFVTSGDLVYALFAAGLIGIVLYGLIGYFASGYIGGILAKIPTRLIYPYILLISFISAYSVRSNIFDIYVMCAAGLFGYLMRKGGFSTAAFVIAFILAKSAEEAFRQSLLMSNDGWLIFFDRPVVMALLGIGLLTVAGRIWSARKTAVA